MKVIFTTWRGSREMDLEDALRPDASDHESGQIEVLSMNVSNANDVLGRLLAALVEKKVFTIEEAAAIAGQEGRIEPK